MPEEPITVGIPLRWIVGIRIAGAALGLGAAFTVGPVVTWLSGVVGGAPGPMRLAARLPLAWAIPVLTIAGLGLGFWVTWQWRREVGSVTVSADGVTLRRAGANTHVGRDRIGGVFTDGRDLVVVDGRTNELLRARSDTVLVPQLSRALQARGYRWQGTADPREHEFAAWVDGDGALDTRAHDLLRARQRALADKRHGAADDARDELRRLGIAVRDRDDIQQYRVVAART